jgi:hypothetical protein
MASPHLRCTSFLKATNMRRTSTLIPTRLESSRARYRDVIARLVAEGAEGIILGCTELPLLIRPEDSSVPLFDTTALHTMSAGMSHAYGGRVRINVTIPGAFLTDISKAWPPAMRSEMERQVPMGRCGEPE